MTVAIQGIGASKGIAIGDIYIFERNSLDVVERAIDPKDVDAEINRFEQAVGKAKDQLSEVKTKIPADSMAEVACFIETHLLMLEDSAVSAIPVDIIRKRLCNAEWALKVQRDALIGVFDAMDDPYLRTRRDDVDHVVNRIQQILSNRDGSVKFSEDGFLEGKVLVADDLTPSDTVLMQHHGIAAFATEFGGPNSHTAILARSLGIPAVVGLHRARQYLADNERVIVDGRQGVLLLDADQRIHRHYEQRRKDVERHVVRRRRLRRKPVVSSDGETVSLHANIELPTDVDQAVDIGAEGIGLYRTEFLFMNRASPPDEEEQVEAYSRVVRAMRGKPVTIRTLDLGADKTVDGVRPGGPASANPALGLRAIRLCLKEQGLFRPQLRAILRASAHGPVRMMIPMLSNTQEVRQVFLILAECRQELGVRNQAFDPDLSVGAMIEVPAAALCADIFARDLDFLSIGTNDLIQYTIAIDRVDDEVSYLYDPMHLAVLRLIQTTIRAGARMQVPVAMCGEMAGDVLFTRLLLGMGLREFSVHPNAVLEVKQAITDSHIGRLKKLTARVMRTLKPEGRAALVAEMNRMER